MNFSNEVVAGVDEAGRGPLAGPVVAAAVILAPGHGIEGLTDSKKVSAKKRAKLSDRIQESAVCWSIGRASVQEIDRLNILQASLLAMQRAVAGLSIRPGLALVDGNQLPALPCPAKTVVRGDALVQCISAASILAKVARDSELDSLDEEYPGYGFSRHKGYPTKQHMDALSRLGVTPVHRRTFGPVKKLLSEA